MTDIPDAVVVGSGPNGLAAAIELAEQGLAVTVYEMADTFGGGMRSAELTLPGLTHDVCSAAHPFAVASPFFATAGLEAHGLQWGRPDVEMAHPLDGGRAALLLRSMDETVAGLGADGRTWRNVFAPIVKNFDQLSTEVLGPIIHVPRSPVVLARFGMAAMQPATLLARRFNTEEAKALFAGSAAHIYRPLTGLATASVGVMLSAAAHHVGWPIAKGGSASIAAAMVAKLQALGGTVVTGTQVRSLADIPDASVKIFDVAPPALLEILGDAMPARFRRGFTRFRFGPGAYKIDLAVEEGIPWAAQGARKAGTVHVGGTIAEIVAAEADVAAGRLPERPFLLVGQQYLVDPSRSRGNTHPVWCYAHVPQGYNLDATDTILRQIERFAPGFRDRIVASHVSNPAAIAAYNPNYVGGDIASGANNLMQLVFRPRVGLDPYATGIAGVAICSASTPPGAGVHGMCGVHAARSAMRTRARRATK